MKVVFTKGHGKYDTMDLLRPDGTIESVQCPKQGIIPHDMVHFAIEHSLNARGFLRRVVKESQPTIRWHLSPKVTRLNVSWRRCKAMHGLAAALVSKRSWTCIRSLAQHEGAPPFR